MSDGRFVIFTQKEDRTVLFKYRVPQVVKAYVGFGLAALTALGTLVADLEVDLPELAGFGGALVTAWGVFRARNAPS